MGASRKHERASSGGGWSAITGTAACVAALIANFTGAINCYAASEPFIGGSAPSVRPPNAPTISKVERDDAFFEKALRGVSKPYPSSLMFLKDQGRWYSPFMHPGMTGRYDLRRWHRSSEKTGEETDAPGDED